MARRYGKVTVTGWITQGGSLVNLWKQREDGYLVLAVALGPTDSVEFLPEPVVFKDGDAVKHKQPSLWLRRNGTWHCSAGRGPGLGDDLVRSWLLDGNAVRLVPEGATDAG